MKYQRLILIICYSFALTACSVDNRLLGFISSPSEDTDNPILEQKSILSGDKLILEPQGGTPPYTYSVSLSGYLNTTTGEYSVPKNAPLIVEDINITDANGVSYILTIRNKGFAERMAIALPQGADDQNYPTDAVWLSGGQILVSAIASDYSGERWAVYRSTDQGANWSRVDHYMGMSYDGESHPLAIAGSGTNAYTCGYSYDYFATDPNLRWEVRASNDAGTTWRSVDTWWITPGGNHECNDIAIAPSTGYIYASGSYDTATTTNWLIRESRDGGTTWTNIYDQPALGFSGRAFQIDVTPSGNLFVFGKNGPGGELYFLRGEETLGTWNWTPSSSIPNIVPFSNYQIYGTLKVLSDTTAYFAFRAASGRILKTTDAGNTWTQVYSGLDFLQGLTVTAGGEIIASGGSYSFGNRWFTVRSSDNGATWTPFNMESSVTTGQNPLGLPIVAAPAGTSVVTFSYNDYDDQISTAHSSDSGQTWSLGGTARFLWSFYSEILSMARTTATELYAAVFHVDENNASPWTIMKSIDNGSNWVIVDSFIPGSNVTINHIIKGHDNAIYVSGWDGTNTLIRRSPDGATWTTVHTLNFAYEKTKLISRNATETLLVVRDPVTFVIYIYASADGVSWSLRRTLSLPVGIEQYIFQDVASDTNGNLYLSVAEYDSAGASTTIPVLLKSTDGGTNWTEIRRSTYSPYNGLLKLHQDKVFFLTGSSLDISLDGGSTWTTDTNFNVQPGFATTIDNTFYMYGADPTGGFNFVVYSRNSVAGTWSVVEDMDAREDALKLEEKYYGWITNNPFLELSENEVYLNSVYGEPYWGYFGWLRELTTL